MDDGRVIYNGPGDGVAEIADPRAVKLPAPVAMRRFAELHIELPPAPMPPEAERARPLIELHDVEFGYDERSVLKGVDLAIYAGDRIALLGPNGSGKSTLVKHMIGLLRPRRGEVLLDGVSIVRTSIAQAAHYAGYVFQSPSHMLFAPSVREELAFGPRNVGQTAEEIRQHTAEALDLMDLAGFDDRPPLTLSFGQQRRLCIASVIAMRSQILLMDEPTAGQDYRSYTQFMDGLQQLGAFAAQVFITHDLDLAISYANRILLFADGQIIADGPPHEVLVDEALLRCCRLSPTSLLEENLRLLPYNGSFKRLETLASLAVS
jgi:energy-coupling factor transport system ATP-binding protein